MFPSKQRIFSCIPRLHWLLRLYTSRQPPPKQSHHRLIRLGLSFDFPHGLLSSQPNPVTTLSTTTTTLTTLVLDMSHYVPVYDGSLWICYSSTWLPFLAICWDWSTSWILGLGKCHLQPSLSSVVFHKARDTQGKSAFQKKPYFAYKPWQRKLHWCLPVSPEDRHGINWPHRL